MPIITNQFSQLRTSPPRPQTHGAVHVAEFIFDASAGLLAADKVDLGVLPAGARIVDAFLSADASLVTGNVTVGILAGEIGNLNDSRVLGTEIFNAVAITNAHTAIVRLANPAALSLAAAANDRSIGLQVSANIIAGAGKIIRLFVEYRQ
jgi:hypothetical protein